MTSEQQPAVRVPASDEEAIRQAVNKQLARDEKARQLILLVAEKQAGKEPAPGKSQAQTEDPFSTLVSDGLVVDPPFDPLFLSSLSEISTELEPITDALCTNVESMGWRLRCLVSDKDQEADPKLKTDVSEEWARLHNFFNQLHPKHSFIDLRCMRRKDYVETGYAGWEVLRSPETGEILGFEHLPSYQLRLGRLKDAYPVDVPVRMLQPDGSYKPGTKRMWVRFRSIVQESIAPVVRGSSVVQSGYKLVYFKEFGDPRVYDVDTGTEVRPKQVESWKDTGKPMPHTQRANEVVFWNRYVGRTPYGLPQHFANMWGIFGSHQAEKVNYHTLRSNNVPAFMLLVHGNGRLTDGTLDRITEFTKATIEGRNNYGRFLVVEAEGDEEDDEPGKVKIEVAPLQGEQITDALYGRYRKDNQADLRRSYRMPPIFLGATEDYSRAVVDTSRSVGDEQVFAPKRNKFDWWVNHRLFPAMKLEGKHGVRFHEFVTNSPNTTDNKELVQILAGSEKTGGMTPRIARMALEDVFGKDLPPFPAKLPNGQPFDPDLPFSLLMADAVKNQADPSEPGQQVTALKVVKMLLGDDSPDGDVMTALTALEEAQQRIEARWRADLKASD